MDEAEIAELQEALYDQYTMMTNLCIELEEEREASATAASEALSVILRLEREKAAEKMEASQYRRIAEEKIQHAEENMAELEDAMQEKEMEISFLRHQLEKYKEKMSGIGMNIHDIEEQREARNRIINENIPSLIRRNTSLPVFKYGQILEEIALSPLSLVLSQRRIFRYLSKIDEAELAKTEKFGMVPEGSGSESPNNALSKTDSNVVEVHDVFEVPESQSSCGEVEKEAKNKNVLSSTESLMIPEAESSSSGESCGELLSRTKIARNCGASSDNDLDQIKKRLEKLEKEKNPKQSNNAAAASGEQHLKLLTEIYEQLVTLEKRMKDTEPQRNNRTITRKDDATLDAVIEAVLSFSI